MGRGTAMERYMSQKKKAEKIGSLPIQRKEDWVMERRPISMEIEELGDAKPDMLVCVSVDTELVLGANVVPPGASGSEIVDWAFECMLSPMAGNPCRPASLTLIGLKELQPVMAQLGIQVTARSLPHPVVDEVISVLEQNLANPGIPPYLIESSLKPAALADFFAAAAEFYRVKPWEQFEYEIPIKLTLHHKEPVDYWAIIMGVGGETFGFTLYRSAQEIINLFETEDDDEALQVGQRTWSIGLTFESADYVGAAAMAECMANEWELAGESAYPSAIIVDPKGAEVFRRPGQQELRDLSVAVRAAARFVEAHREEIRDEDTVEETIRVEALGETVTVDMEFPAPEFIEEDEREDEDDLRLPAFLSPTVATELDRARELVSEAEDEDSKTKRVKLAKQALALSPDCSEAYLLLAEDTARDAAEKLNMLQQAIDAGKRVIGEQSFRELQGNFWLARETRPYMTARLRLAEFHVEQRDFAKAIDVYQDMLRLNPNDNQAARYPLAMCLISADRDEDAKELIERYETDRSAFCLYTSALLSYRQSGDSKEAGEDLSKAIAKNQHVVGYLLERKRLPAYDPDSYQLGSQDEAILYVGMFMGCWKSTEGAIEWLAKSAASLPAKRANRGKGE
jgi:tetratricopeptide (TPR) repeat protein